MANTAEEERLLAALLGELDDSWSKQSPVNHQALPDPTKSKKSDLTSSLDSVPTTASKSSSRAKSPSPVKQHHSPRKPLSTTEQHTEEKSGLEQLLDGADAWDMDWADMDDEVISKPQTTAQKRVDLPIVTRCRVLSVSEWHESGKTSKLLAVQSTTSGLDCHVHLLDEWQYLNIYKGDIVNIIGTFPDEASSINSSTLDSKPSVVVSASQNFIILHPDILISATLISQTSYCARRPIIGSLIPNSAPQDPSVTTVKSTAWIWGNFVHEIMQLCFQEKAWKRCDIEEKINAILQSPRGIAEVFRAGVNVEEAKRQISERAQGLATFGERYISIEPLVEATLSNTRAKEESSSTLAVTDLHDIEEDMISPTYGIKGKVDVSLKVTIERHEPKGGVEVSRSEHSLPFEIKTGRAAGVMEHRAQTTLYSLLMGERYGIDVSSGLLYYTQSEEVIEVPKSDKEIRGLLMRRNDIAEQMMRRQRPDMKTSFLPDHLEDKWACTKCYAVDACMLYRRAVERVKDTGSEIAELYEKTTGHLTHDQCEFFKTWEELVSLEEQDMVRLKKELWTMTASERQMHGRCFADMVLHSGGANDTHGVNRVHQFTYEFRRSTEHEEGTLLKGHLNINDPVMVSVEPNLLVVARGSILQLYPHRVVIGVDRELNVQTLRSRSFAQDCENALVFRIDKDDLAAGIGRIRDNLAALFYAHGDVRRRSQVVDLTSPCFSVAALPEWTTTRSLNLNQKRAVEKVLRTQDYCLILGMPGTGKTTTVAEIIKLLIAAGNTVLLASYTHSAVDNILLKLIGVDCEILRIGNADKVHPAARCFTLDGRSGFNSLAHYEQAVLQPPLVATTCLSIDHPLFSRRHFDYCIIDEASQITLPTCIGPLRFADKFVLVGDHFQLPPLIRSKAAREGGYDVSLFRRLSEAHPHSVVELVDQYRMNEDIMTLSNRLIYSDRLQCGSVEIASRSLLIPQLSALATVHTKPCPSEGCWMDRLLDASCKAVFVDTDGVPAMESYHGNLPQNEIEANLVYQTAETLVRCGVAQHDIGIVSLYRQQLKLIRNLLNEREDIELLTADKSQGRDKECVIISMVRSNDVQQIGDLLKDWRRINVAFTRARSKLIIFGSRRTLSGAPVLSDFIKLMDERQWSLHLPPGSDKIHALSHLPTKRRAATVELPVQMENIPERSSPKRKIAKRGKFGGEKLSSNLLKTRPILGDILNGRK